VQVFLVVLAVVAGIAIYVVLSIVAIVFVTIPLGLLGMAIGLPLGSLLPLQRTALVLTNSADDVGVCTPRDVVAGRLPGQVSSTHVRRDLAWPHYFVAQVWLDLRAIVTSSAIMSGRAWVWVARLAGRTEPVVYGFAWPLMLPALLALLAATVGVAAGALLVAAVFATLSGLLWLIGYTVVWTLRTVDRARQVFHKADGFCVNCHAVTRLPMYECPGPHSDEDHRDGTDLHRDLRPGRLGLFWRRCGCGRLLPTTVRRANRGGLLARCPTCTKPMHKDAAVAKNIRIPVFGAASAGKTQLIMRGLVSLLGRAGPGVAVEPADDESERTLSAYATAVHSGGAAIKTATSLPPIAVTLRLTFPTSTALVHVFDVAGEVLADPDQNAKLAYLDSARTLIFVLDPFSIPDVRDEFAAQHAGLFATANAAIEDPDHTYNATVTRLRDYGVSTQRQHLAFVISKWDLLARLKEGAGLGGAAPDLRGWLVERRLDNLVLAAERDFQSVDFHLVSSTDPALAEAAFAPFRQLLERDSVKLPQEVST